VSEGAGKKKKLFPVVRVKSFFSIRKSFGEGLNISPKLSLLALIKVIVYTIKKGRICQTQSNAEFFSESFQ